MFTEYEPASYLPYISPTPLLLLVAEGDDLAPSELAIAAYDTAHEPKKLVILSGGHFDAYVKALRRRERPGPRLVRPAPGALRPARLELAFAAAELPLRIAPQPRPSRANRPMAEHGTILLWGSPNSSNDLTETAPKSQLGGFTRVLSPVHNYAA